MLKGKRIVLRSIREGDCRNFLRWLNDAEINRYLLISSPVTETAERKWIQKTTLNQEPVFVIEVIGKKAGKNKAIGVCGLHRTNHRHGNAEFGIFIGEKSCWHKGYGPEAARLVIDHGFNSLNLHRIYSGSFSENERSIKLHKKLGFVQEGLKKEHIYKNGHYNDHIDFGLLREEWQK